MKHSWTILSVLVLTAGFVAWHTWTSTSPEQLAKSTSASGEQLDPANSWVSGSKRNARPGTSHPGQNEAVPGAITPPPVKEIDLGQHVATHPDCSVVTQLPNPETFELEDAYACDPALGEPHPYEAWSSEVLATMAYGDAKAAEVLGLRHIRSEEPNQEAFGLMLLYRSVALSGDTEPLRKAVGQRYAYVSIDGKPQLHNIRQLLVFSLIRDRLGEPNSQTAALERRLAAADVPPEEIQKVKQVTRQILHEMARIQTEVTGISSIAEVLADA